MDKRAIGIFDSGIGGLTVTKEVIKTLPNESIVYLGDTARVPYGTRSKEIVAEFAKELVAFLLKKNVKALVVACNTITALAFDEIQKISPVSVIGVIDPAVKKAVSATKNKKIGVIGTPGTIASRIYESKIKLLDPEIEVTSVGCPLFVSLAEEGMHKHKATELVAREYLEEIKASGIDTLILGCTHYPLLLDVISNTVGSSIELIDSAKPTAIELKKLLEDKKLLSDNKNPKLEIFVTDAPERVYRVASHFFGQSLNGKIKKVTL